MDLITILDPPSVLDVGVGFGKYGILCREYLELWDGRQQYSNFKRRIDGVEAFGPYITELHKYAYNNVYVGDVRDLIDKLEFRYDLVLLIDVLEHFKKAEGELLLKKLLQKNLGILISTPKKPSEQRNAFGNDYETHKSKWTKKDILNLLNIMKTDSNDTNVATKSTINRDISRSSYFIGDPVSVIGYVGSAELVRKLLRKRLIRKVGKVPYAEVALKLLVRTLRSKGTLLITLFAAISFLMSMGRIII